MSDTDFFISSCNAKRSVLRHCRSNRAECPLGTEIALLRCQSPVVTHAVDLSMAPKGAIWLRGSSLRPLAPRRDGGRNTR